MKKIIIATIVFVLVISCNRTGKGPVMATDNAMTQESPHGMTGSPGKVTADKVDVKIEKTEGIVTIANCSLVRRVIMVRLLPLKVK
ncbi:MAG: hypothetical protein R2727_02355 [Bacteroidales bacterium]